MFKILSLAFTVAAFLATIVLIVGYISPISYEGQLQANLEDSPKRIWEELTNVHEYPDKKRDVESVRVIDSFGEARIWEERLKRGGYRIYEVLEQETNKYWMIELKDSSNGVTGVWLYQIKDGGDEAIVLITEKSENRNIWLRGLWTFAGRNILMFRDFKWLRVALFDRLIDEI